MSGKKFVLFWGSWAVIHFKASLFALRKNSQFALEGTFAGLGTGWHKIQVFSGCFEEASLMFPCVGLFWKVL